MKKLKLDAEALRVETFDTADGSSARAGTVAGAAVGGFVATDDTAKPDCDLSGSNSCGHTFCGNETCDTCDYNTYCGRSCILVCDDEGVTAADV
ncbi:MAG TPA: hypothetical protein VFS20_31780 [Longimicrobium sp.]|nr:hypothetical protein [Longimicrobium sp.]